MHQQNELSDELDDIFIAAGKQLVKTRNDMEAVTTKALAHCRIRDKIKSYRRKYGEDAVSKVLKSMNLKEFDV